MKLGEVAQALGASLEGGSEDVEITGVATLEDAVPGQITFLADRRHEALVAGTTASAILLAPGAPAASPSQCCGWRTPTPPSRRRWSSFIRHAARRRVFTRWR